MIYDKIFFVDYVRVSSYFSVRIKFFTTKIVQEKLFANAQEVIILSYNRFLMFVLNFSNRVMLHKLKFIIGLISLTIT